MLIRAEEQRGLLDGDRREFWERSDHLGEGCERGG